MGCERFCPPAVAPPVPAHSRVPAQPRSGHRPRLVGINHVAIEVGDIGQALAFYGEIFDFAVGAREDGLAFVRMGDQFLALSEARAGRPPDAARHFGLVVDDRPSARAALAAAGVELLPGGRLDFRDPWGSRVQVVDYRDIQFTKRPSVLTGMGLVGLRKRPAAVRELRENGLR
jgi:catechol 2,3-dioxygenase-like lactoylglutathione lyase family enzyme